MFPKDLDQAPREFAERFFNLKRWTQMPRGGHFAAMEKPDLLASDIRAFFRPLRRAGEKLFERRVSMNTTPDSQRSLKA